MFGEESQLNLRSSYHMKRGFRSKKKILTNSQSLIIGAPSNVVLLRVRMVVLKMTEESRKEEERVSPVPT